MHEVQSLKDLLRCAFVRLADETNYSSRKNKT